MSDMLLIGGVFVTCIIVVILAGFTLQLQRKVIERLQAQQLAWEKAQEVQRQHWEARQDKHFYTLEKAQEVQRQHWEAQQNQHFHTLEKALFQHIEETALLEHKLLQHEQTRVKNELSHLPR